MIIKTLFVGKGLLSAKGHGNLLPMIDVKSIRSGDPLSISRAISEVEAFSDKARTLIDEIAPHVGQARRIGVTGPPGCGKSTLVDALAREIRATGATVGIIAVDPSSPFTGGALLGDRIRMSKSSGDGGITIRSMASRDGHGGIARAALDAADLMDAAGKTFILTETVGVGQSEIEISRCADCVILVLSPESGDGIQAMKAGIMEIADLVVINKADREGADRLEWEIRSAYELALKRRNVRILLTEAIHEKGIGELRTAIEAFMREQTENGSFDERRKSNMRHRILTITEFLVKKDLWGSSSRQSALDRLTDDVLAHRASPYRAAESMLETLQTKREAGA